MTDRFVAYYRVSTEKQSRSGLGLEAQKQAVANYLNCGSWALLGEFVEQESGGDRTRPELAKAIVAAKKAKATLVVAKLDRLARDTRFVLELADAKVKLRFVDLPELRIDGSAADRLMLTQFASFAEFERRIISERTRAALAAKRARGEPLGNPATLRPGNTHRAAQARADAERLRGVLAAFAAQRLSQRAQVVELNRLGVRAARGGTWGLSQLQRMLGRLLQG